MSSSVSDPVRVWFGGAPKWLFADGTVLPVVSGGSDNGSAGGDNGAGDTSEEPDTGGAGGGDNPPAKVTFTPEQQAHIDKLLNDQFGKGAAKGAREREEAITAYLKEQGLSETERLAAERDAATQRAEQATAAANQRIVRAEARVAAMAAGVKADRLDRFLRLVDLDDVNVDDDGPDAKAIEAAVTRALADVPEFKATQAAGASGADMNGTPGKLPAKNLEDAVTARLTG